jgi:hypothetical protein
LPGPTLDELAHLLAPALWFSPDEPLLARTHALPAPLPCDAADQATVYYQPIRVMLQSADLGFPLRADERLMANVTSLVIRFFFYYPRDIGFEGHRHDLEAADFGIEIDHLAADCYQIRLDKVVGLAHGVDWYNNRLQIAADTKLPLTLLVEEGKHASAPDRNADGIYTPGYDVNERINDAWGVRDVLGSSYLGGAGQFSATMSKHREPGSAMLPPAQAEACLVPAPWVEHAWGEVLGRYQLRPAWAVAGCHGYPDEGRLREMFENNGFGQSPRTTDGVGITELMTPWRASTLWPSVSLRWDRRLGLAFAFRGLDLRDLYLVPKLDLGFDRELAIELLVTPTASQTVSRYLSMGPARERLDDQLRWTYALETGFKIRFRLEGWQRALAIGHRFGGFRFGVRASGFPEFDSIRFIAEIGAGTW